MDTNSPSIAPADRGFSLPVIKRTGNLYKEESSGRIESERKPQALTKVMNPDIPEPAPLLEKSEIQRVLSMISSYRESEIPLHFEVAKGSIMDIFA